MNLDETLEARIEAANESLRDLSQTWGRYGRALAMKEVKTRKTDELGRKALNVLEKAMADAVFRLQKLVAEKQLVKEKLKRQAKKQSKMDGFKDFKCPTKHSSN